MALFIDVGGRTPLASCWSIEVASYYSLVQSWWTCPVSVEFFTILYSNVLRARGPDLVVVTAPSVTAAMPCPASCTLGITPWTGQWSTNSLATPYATRSVVVSAGSTTTSLDCKHDVFSRLYLAPTAAPSNAIYSLDDNCNLVASVSDGPGASAVVA